MEINLFKKELQYQLWNLKNSMELLLGEENIQVVFDVNYLKEHRQLGMWCNREDILTAQFQLCIWLLSSDE